MKSTSSMTKDMFTILLGLIVVVFVSDTFAQGTWDTKAPMPTARTGVATGIVNGKLYVLGGAAPGPSGLNSNEAYDPATDTWTTKAPMPTSRAYASAADIASKLYVVGGFSHPPTTVLATLEVYDPATDTWATKAAMPAPRHVLGAGEVNGILYAVSGALADNTFVNTVEAYDPAANMWTTVAPIPTARTSPQPQGINGVLYVAGNGSGGTPIATLEAFTPVIEVTIDITPGSFPNSINPHSRGVIPVAILTTGTFDASTVDPNTVRFGRTGTEVAAVHSALEDVDGDGDIDLILQFNTQDTGIVCGDTSASLKGQTFGGQAIEGADSIGTVPCK